MSFELVLNETVAVLNAIVMASALAKIQGGARGCVDDYGVGMTLA